MDPSIVVALISAAVTIVSVWATYRQNANKITREFEKANAEWQRQARETDHKLELKLVEMGTRLDGLATEVRKHNGFAERLPAVEQKVKDIAEQIKHN
jgi:hypothetical protein